MREQIDTIPISEAFESGDECPFCYLERKAEQSALRYIAGPGASYMEPDVRAVTDETGFCTAHMQKLYDYGNSLGAALMLQSHMARLIKILDNAEMPTPQKKPLFGKRPAQDNPFRNRLLEQCSKCYLCDKLEYNRNRYFHAFFVMLRDKDFQNTFASSKGVCLRHFGTLLEKAPEELPEKLQGWFYDTAYQITLENFCRVKEDLDWFIDKHDYRNAGADWKNARDALSRSMEKIQGLHPADPPYKMK